MTEIIIATVALLFSIIVGIVKICKQDKGIYLQDIRLFFLLAFTLYSVFLPIVYIFYCDVMKFSDRAFVNMIWLYTSAVVAYDIVLFTNKTRWANPEVTAKPCKTYFFAFGILAILVAYSFYYMVSQGIQTFALGEDMVSRSRYGQAVHQSWIVLTIAIAVIFNFLLFHFKKLSFFWKIVFLGLLFFYVAYQVSLGNRREYATIVLFFACYYLCIKKIPLNKKLLVFLILGFVGSFFLPMIRDAATRDLNRQDMVQTAILSNEFIYPQQTTYYTMRANPEYKFGYTYTVLPIQVAIPRAIYPNKPQTLGAEFIRKIIDTNQGYAYTPVTEAFINFGYIGPFVIFYLLGLFLNKLVREVQVRGASFKYMIIFAYCFDFCRSEFSSVAYSFLIIFITYKIISAIVGGKRRLGLIRSQSLKINLTENLKA